MAVLLLLVFVKERHPSGKRVYGYSVEGRELVCHERGHGEGGILFMGAIHGSEGATAPLVEALLKRLPKKLAKPIRVIVVANPDGLLRGDRLNRRGVDLNRNFPADNREEKSRYGTSPLSEPESRALYDLLEQTQPDVIVSVHQPLACVDFDGPPEAETLARRMAAVCDLPVKKLGSRPGSLGAYIGDKLKRSIITLELPPLAPLDGEKLWARYGAALLEALSFLDS